MNKIPSSFNKKNISFILIFCSIAFSISCFVVSPIYVYLSTNILYKYTLIPNIVSILVSIIDIIIYAACFSTITYSIYRTGRKSTFPLILTYSLAILVKYILNVVVQIITGGASTLTSDLIFVLLNYVFELITLILVIISVSLVLKDKQKNSDPINFDKLLYFKEPFNRAILSIGIVLSAIKIVTRLLYDISYGAPSSLVEILWMVFYYSLDMLICPIVYLVSFIITVKHEKRFYTKP